MTRWLVVAGLFVLSIITYIDRAAISSVKDQMSAELALTDSAMGAIFGAFALGYALAQIPSGWFADRAGPRLMLTLVVIAWSALTAATGIANSLWSLWVIRFLFGVAEAGAFPGAARAFYAWLPSSEHGRANGIVFAGARLGAAGAFPVMAWLLDWSDWRMAFFVLAGPGILWAIAWAWLFRNEPPRPVAKEPTAEASEGRPLGRPMLLAMLQYFFANFTTFLCLSWMNPYLKQRYQLTTGEAAFYSMLPLLFGAGAQWATGVFVDRLYRSRYGTRSRQIPAMTGFVLSAAGLAAIPHAASPGWAAAFFTVAAFGAEMTISPSWAFCLDTGGAKAGAVSGSMNMLGNLGSFVSANAFPLMQRLTGTASAYFWMVALLNILAASCWAGMRSRTIRQPGRSGA